ncbi:MAG: PHP domain-containing protein, partial [Clostridiales bacterium]|nr:PHP domain-containing protein [Clostridiales bacterium]
MFADLHIHSCLSPCGHEWMTPGNIAGMAKLKELDAIAIADHNCAKNLRAADAVCRAYGVVLVPAMEITTREEAHLLGYFETVEQAEGMSDWLYERLPDI